MPKRHTASTVTRGTIIGPTTRRTRGAVPSTGSLRISADPLVLQADAGRVLGGVHGDAGYDEARVGRVRCVVRRDGRGRAAPDDEVQVLEDAMCLVFLETQFADIAARVDPAKLPGVITKTAAK